MKSRMQVDSKLTSEDKTNLSIATKQTIKLSKFSLRKRINVLKNEWWYWDDIMQATLINGIPAEESDAEEDRANLIQDQENDTEEILQLLSTSSNELVAIRSFSLLHCSSFICRKRLFVCRIFPPIITIPNPI